MTVYSLGLEALAARKPYDVRPLLRATLGHTVRPLSAVGLLTTTPGSQLAKIEALNSAIDSFMHDVAAYAPAPPLEGSWSAWRAQVAGWVEQWRAFREQAGYFQRLNDDTDAVVDSYRTRYCQLTQDFSARWRGVMTLAAPVECLPTSAPGNFWRTLGIGVAASLTVAGILYLLRGAHHDAPSGTVFVVPQGAVMPGGDSE